MWGASGEAYILDSPGITLVPPMGQVYSSRTPAVCPCLSSRAADFSSKGPIVNCSRSGPRHSVNDGMWLCSDNFIHKDCLLTTF